MKNMINFYVGPVIMSSDAVRGNRRWSK